VREASVSAQNKAILQRVYDIINSGDLSRAEEVIPPDSIEHEEVPGLPPGTPGLEVFRHFVTTFRAAFPDLRITAEDVIAEGDKVVARFTMRGTHRGEFMGIGPTGESISVTGIDIVRVVGGKAVEHWGQTDALGLLQQLGAIPAPGQAGG
jgi:predicted ester cyclase